MEMWWGLNEIIHVNCWAMRLLHNKHSMLAIVNSIWGKKNNPREIKVIFLGLGIILERLWRNWIQFLSNYTWLQHWLLPYFPNDVYPCGHYRGLLCHFNNQNCKFPLSIKSKQSILKGIDISAWASTSIKPDVLPLPLPKVSIFLWSIVKASLSIETSSVFTEETRNHSMAVTFYLLSRSLPFCNLMLFKMKFSWSFSWKYLLMSKSAFRPWIIQSSNCNQNEAFVYVRD